MRQILLLLCLCSFGWCAPAPFPKPARPICREDVVGTWTIQWFQAKYVILLCQDGFMASRHINGENYETGSWTIKGDVLYVDEGYMRCDWETGGIQWSSSRKWEIRMERTESGFRGVLVFGGSTEKTIMVRSAQ